MAGQARAALAAGFGALLLCCGPAHAEDQHRLIVEQMVERVDQAIRAGDEEALRALATRQEPDPWLVAERLFERRDPSHAVAFAAMASGKANEGLAAYLKKRLASGPLNAPLLDQVTAALARGAFDEVVKQTRPLAEGPHTVTALQVAMTRARALAMRNELEAAANEAAQVAHAAREIGWLRQACEAYRMEGAAHYRRQALQAARKAWTQRVQLARAIGRQDELAQSIANIANLHMLAGEHEEARRHLDEAQRIASEIGNQEVIGVTANTLAVIAQMVEGRIGEALDHLERARDAFVATGHEQGVFSVLTNIANCRTQLGHYAEALVAYEQCLVQATKLGDPIEIARARNNLGSLLKTLGRGEEAMANFRQAVELFQAQQHLVGYAQALQNIGDLHFDQSRYEEALHVYRRSLQVRRKTKRAGAVAAGLNAVAGVHWVRGELDDARRLYREALALEEQEGRASAVARALANLAVVEDAKGNPAEGIALLDRALALDPESPTSVARTRGLLAMMYLRLEKPEKALAQAQQGARLVAQISSDLSDEEGASAKDDFEDLFRQGFLAALRANRVEALHDLIEQARGASLRLRLGSRAAWDEALVPASLHVALRSARAAERDARAALDAAKATLARRPMAKATTALSAAQHNVQEASRRLERARKNALPVTAPAPHTLAQVTAALADNEAVLSLCLTDKDAVALVVTGMGARAVSLSDSRRIEQDARAVLRDHGAPGPALERLRKAIAVPVALPDSVRRILISPSGVLGYVPFALLFPDREVVLVPSATTMGLLRQASTLRGDGVLALGDPQYPAGRLARLPATRAEVTAVGTVRLLGKDATEAALHQHLGRPGRWRAVHLACHGLIDPERPMLSALAITPDEENDGRLSALEVFRLKVPADLVVLSACETGKGKIYQTEGIVGLTRAFMFAGTPRVLCSLWNVDDDATRALMVKFYELWNPPQGEGLSAAAAVKKAQMHMRGHEKWQHPRYWAAWVLWGLP